MYLIYKLVRGDYRYWVPLPRCFTGFKIVFQFISTLLDQLSNPLTIVVDNPLYLQLKLLQLPHSLLPPCLPMNFE